MKNRPIIDVFILASGFVIRIFYGAFLTENPISAWFCLVVMAGSVFMGLGKRRNELEHQEKDIREVSKYYTFSFLNSNMYIYATLVNVFYSLWAMEFPVLGTVPIFMAIMMRYSLDVERDSDGDPVEVILHDQIIMILIIVYVLIIFILLYVI